MDDWLWRCRNLRVKVTVDFTHCCNVHLWTNCTSWPNHCETNQQMLHDVFPQSFWPLDSAFFETSKERFLRLSETLE